MYRRITQFFLLAVFLAFGFSALAQVTAPDFSVVVLPDTQYYSQSYPQIFNEQTQWIVNNQASYNIQFVLGEGDVVNIAEQPRNGKMLTPPIGLLDTANIPYVWPSAITIMVNEEPSARDTSAFNSYFGPSRYASLQLVHGRISQRNQRQFLRRVYRQRKTILDPGAGVRAPGRYLGLGKDVLDANPDKEIIVRHAHLHLYRFHARRSMQQQQR